MDCLSAAVDRLPERPEHSASRYTNRDAVNGAFGAFFFQFPSLLRYMREMRDEEKRDNAQSLFDVSGIPSDNQIRNIVDGIDPSAIGRVFNDTLTATRQSGLIDEYRVLDKGVLLALEVLQFREDRLSPLPDPQDEGRERERAHDALPCGVGRRDSETQRRQGPVRLA